MKRSTTTLRLAALASASAIVLAACGGGDDSNDDSSKDVAKGDGEFVVGSLLPQTGSLAFLGPPEFAGVDLAVQEINEAGGVLGKDARHVKGDSGDTDSGIAPAEADKLIKAKADVIVGAAPSDVLQGAVMANLLVEDGRENVAILARQDSYGETLAEQVKSGLEAAGS